MIVGLNWPVFLRFFEPTFQENIEIFFGGLKPLTGCVPQICG
jgi:hypothetical protein